MQAYCHENSLEILNETEIRARNPRAVEIGRPWLPLVDGALPAMLPGQRLRPATPVRAGDHFERNWEIV